MGTKNSQKPTQQFDMTPAKKQRKSPSGGTSKLQKRARQANWNKALLKSSCAALRRIAIDSKLSQSNYAQLVKEINAIQNLLELQIASDYKKDKITIQALDAMEKKNKQASLSFEPEQH